MAYCPKCPLVVDCYTLVEVDEVLGGVSEGMEHFQLLMELSARLKDREDALRVKRQELDRVVLNHFARQLIDEERTG